MAELADALSGHPLVAETLDPLFGDLLDPETRLRELGTGYAWVEGPVWHPTGQYLLFSDIPGDVRRRWNARGGVTEVARPTNMGNGLTLDRELNLLACEHVSSSVARYDDDGVRTELAARFEGRELNSPNDLVVRSDGSVYFTDPTYGRMPGYGVERDLPLGFQGVYRIPADGGELQLLVGRDTYQQPNGLCFSPDERLLYVNDTDQANIRVYDVRVDGRLENESVFADGLFATGSDGVRDDDLGVPDGMKCDELGNVWVTAPGGLGVFAPDGRLLGRIRVPQKVANLCWGGPEWRTLFLTASSSVYALETRVGPRREPFMR